jgi:hypothetical protein
MATNGIHQHQYLQVLDSIPDIAHCDSESMQSQLNTMRHDELKQQVNILPMMNQSSRVYTLEEADEPDENDENVN